MNNNSVWLKVGAASQILLVWLLFATNTSIFAQFNQTLLLLTPIVGLLLALFNSPTAAITFFAATAGISFIGGDTPGLAFYALSIGLLAAQAFEWQLRGRVWNFRRLAKQGVKALRQVAPVGVTTRADIIESPSLQAARYKIYQENKLAAVVIAVGNAYIDQIERRQAIADENEGVPHLVMPLEYAPEPAVMQQVIEQALKRE